MDNDGFELVDRQGNTYNVSDIRYQNPTPPTQNDMMETDDSGSEEERDNVLTVLRARTSSSARTTWAADVLHRPKWKDDTEVKSAAMKCVKSWLQNMPSFALTDKNLCELFNEKRPLLKDNEDMILALAGRISCQVFGDGPPLCALKYASRGIQGDCRFVLSLMTWAGGSPRTLKYAQPNVQQDRELIPMLVLKLEDLSFLKYAAEDRELAKRIVRVKGMALSWLPAFQFDAEVVIEAVQSSGRALEHASTAMQDDEQVVKLAVRNDGSALQFASQRLRDANEVIMAAVEQEGLSFHYASDRLKKNRSFVVRAAGVSKWVLGFVPDDIKRDKQAMMEVVSANPWALSQVSDELRDDPDVVVQAVAGDGSTFQFASDRLKNDNLTVLLAVTANGQSLFFADERFRGMKAIMMEAAKSHPFALQFAGDFLLLDEEVILQALLHVEAKNLTSFWDFHFCLPMKQRIRTLALRLCIEHGDDSLILKLSATDARRYSTSPCKKRKTTPGLFDLSDWKRRHWERIWAVGQIGRQIACRNEGDDAQKRPGLFSDDICRSIVEFAGLPSAFSHEKELSDLEPLVNTMLSLGLYYDERQPDQPISTQIHSGLGLGLLFSTRVRLP